MNIEWLPPLFTEQNGPITYYRLTLVSGQVFGTLEYNTTALSLNITKLHPFYNYDCYITAMTIAPGPSALISFQMAEDGKCIA